MTTRCRAVAGISAWHFEHYGAGSWLDVQIYPLGAFANVWTAAVRLVIRSVLRSVLLSSWSNSSTLEGHYWNLTLGIFNKSHWENSSSIFLTMTRITDNLHGNLFAFMTVCCRILIPVDARPKAWVCGRSLAGTADSNPTGDMGVSLLLGKFFSSGLSHVQRSPTERGVSWV